MYGVGLSSLNPGRYVHSKSLLIYHGDLPLTFQNHSVAFQKHINSRSHHITSIPKSQTRVRM